jgi:transposase
VSFPRKIDFQGGRKINVTFGRKAMKRILRQGYTTEFKELAVKRVKDGVRHSVGARELGLVEQTLHNWVKIAEVGESIG